MNAKLNSLGVDFKKIMILADLWHSKFKISLQLLISMGVIHMILVVSDRSGRKCGIISH